MRTSSHASDSDANVGAIHELPLRETLPEGWVLKKLNDVCNIIMGQSPPGNTYNKDKSGLPFFQGKAEFGVRYPTAVKWCSKPKKVAHKNDVLISVRAPVGPTNIASSECCIGRGLAAIRPLEGTDYFNRARKVSENVLEEHKHRYSLKLGDFIFGKIGTIGKPVKLYPPFNFALSANIVLIQPQDSILLPAFCFSYMDSPLMDHVIRKESRATTQAAFGIQKVRIIPIPLPPLSEQQNIIEEVERRLSVAEDIEIEIETNLKRAERLRQSILKKAFSGKLLSQ